MVETRSCDPSEPMRQPCAAGSIRWQFGLKHLFAVTTYAALMSASVVWFGPQFVPGNLMATAGLLVAWLNTRGAFSRLQQGPVQRNMLLAAWMMFAVSFILPCLHVSFSGSGSYYWGWQLAAWFFSQVIEPGTNLGTRLSLIPIDAANLLQALLPLLAWRLHRGGGRWLGSALCISAAAVWGCLWIVPGLHVGYYVWCASFFMVLVAFPVKPWVLIGMVAVLPMTFAQLLLT